MVLPKATLCRNKHYKAALKCVRILQRLAASTIWTRGIPDIRVLHSSGGTTVLSIGSDSSVDRKEIEKDRN